MNTLIIWYREVYKLITLPCTQSVLFDHKLRPPDTETGYLISNTSYRHGNCLVLSFCLPWQQTCQCIPTPFLDPWMSGIQLSAIRSVPWNVWRSSCWPPAVTHLKNKVNSNLLRKYLPLEGANTGHVFSNSFAHPSQICFSGPIKTKSTFLLTQNALTWSILLASRSEMKRVIKWDKRLSCLFDAKRTRISWGHKHLFNFFTLLQFPCQTMFSSSRA